MQISDKALALINCFGAFRAFVYRDAARLFTVGHGHRLKPGESYPHGVTDAQATGLLRVDVATAEYAFTPPRVNTVGLKRAYRNHAIFEHQLPICRVSLPSWARSIVSGSPAGIGLRSRSSS